VIGVGDKYDGVQQQMINYFTPDWSAVFYQISKHRSVQWLEATSAAYSTNLQHNLKSYSDRASYLI
jgi:hypothetical protein